MFKNINIPASYYAMKKGKVFLVLKEEYRDDLLQQRIEDIEAFLQTHREASKYLLGRLPHASIPLKDEKRMVIRRYSHGGVFRSFTRDLYLSGARSIRELALTERIISRGIPTIQPIGAIHRSVLSPFYKAYLLSLEISDAKDLIQYLQEIGPYPSRERLLHKRKTIRSAGLLVRQFHDAGFFHGDLQLKNMLVSGEHLFLIDFDHSYQKKVLTADEKKKNLLRLNRSVEKWKSLGLPITRTDRLRFFHAYAEKDKEIRKTMEKALRTYSVRHFFYRWSWALQRILGFQGSRVIKIAECALNHVGFRAAMHPTWCMAECRILNPISACCLLHTAFY
jgi:tRNA A-37 threonylcarbamoyl transferase component Bud32